jgi:ABC-2 type transport system permease protein
MMSDLWTVLRKELKEVTGRGALRGVSVQLMLVVFIAGVVLPGSRPNLFASAASAALNFLVFPPLLAASIAADAFAGEYERRTLETLLATPLPDGAIFLGKTLAAVLVAVGSALSILVFAVAVARLALPSAAMPTGTLSVALWGASLGSSLSTSALATLTSSRLRVARAAQQISSLVAMMLGGLATATLGRFGFLASAPRLLLGDALLLAVGVVALLLTQAGMRRQR